MQLAIIALLRKDRYDVPANETMMTLEHTGKQIECQRRDPRNK